MIESSNEEKEQEANNLKVIGFSADNKGNFEFNANIFADFFLENVKLIIFQDNFFYHYKAGIWQPITDRQVMRIIRKVINRAKPNLYQRQMGQNAIEILKLAAPERNEIDTDGRLINLKNGMLCLETYEMIDHSPDYYSTVQVPIIYDAAAKCPKFENFLWEIFEGDAGRIAVMQELMGYLLTTETKIHKAFFFYGDGANGKSVLLEIITMLVGRPNVSNISLKDLEKPFNRAALMGKTVNIATENEVTGRGFDSQYLKAIVSGDGINVEKKFQDPISYSPICKLIFATNNLPVSPDCSYGFYRRIMIIPFNKQFTAETADIDLKNKLEGELAGILNWSLMGLRRLRQQKYNFSESVFIDQAFSKYKTEQNPMPEYIAERLIHSPGSRTKKCEIVDEYYAWCKENGIANESKMSSQRFWSIFRAGYKESGFVYSEQTSSGIRYLKNVLLKRICR